MSHTPKPDVMLPSLSWDHPMFWPAQAVKAHTLHTLLVDHTRTCGTVDAAVLLSLITGASSIKRDAHRAFMAARDAGLILHAWHGSVSLVREW